jgi:hypothetical protein
MRLRERGLALYGRAVDRAAWAGERVLTLLALLAGVSLVLGVDKIRGLFVPPDPTLVFQDLRVAGVWFWILWLTGLYALAVLAVWTRGDAQASALAHPWIPSGLHRWLTAPARTMNRLVRAFLELPLFRIEPGGRGLEVRFIVGLVVTVGGGLGAWLLDGPTMVLGTSLVWFGLWLVFSDPLDASNEVPPDRLRATLVGGRGLLISLSSGLLGLATWHLVNADWNPLTHRLFTIWATLHFCAGWLCLAAFLDAVARSVPGRLVLGLGAMALIGLVENRELIVGEGACAHETDWMDAMEARLRAVPDPDGPLLLVAASGGGTRAALHATLVLEALERTPVRGDIGQWDLLSEDSLAEQILLISSVSGGSVGSAHWITEQPEVEPWCAGRSLREGVIPQDCALRNTIDVELERELLEEHERLCTLLDPGEGRWDTLCNADVVDGWQPDNDWPTRSRRFDELSTDFTAPLIGGVLLSGIERGEAMSSFWSQRFGWDWESDDPLLLINVTDVDSGARVVSGHPHLPPELMPGGSGASLVSAHPVSAGRCLTLPESVRLSANFPWGFGLPRVEGEASELLMLDGGVLDNSGVDTLAELFELLALHADHATGGHVPLVHQRARDLLDAIAPRGLVLLEIDSGAKPEEPSLIARGPLEGLLMPVHSLNTSSYARSLAATRANVARIEGVLETWTQRMVATGVLEGGGHGSRHPDGCYLADGDSPTNLDIVGGRVEHVVYALDTESIVTAWALTPKQKAHILARFLNEDASQRPALRDAYEDLRGRSDVLALQARVAVEDPRFASLLETLAWDSRRLMMIQEADQVAAADRRASQREAVEGSPPRVPRQAEPTPATPEGWSLVGTWTGQRWASSVLDFGGEEATGRLAAGSRLELGEPLLVRGLPPDLSSNGWSFASGVVHTGACVELVEVCSIALSPGAGDACGESVEGETELVFARLRGCGSGPP